MKFERFQLERWLIENKTNYKYMLSSAGVHNLRLGELTKKLDPDIELKYGTSVGSDIIREEISELYDNVEKDEVMLTITTSEANLLAAFAIVERADEVITTIPTYMQIWGISKAIGAKVVELLLKEEEEWRPNIDTLNELVSKKTKLIYVTNPNNPTGTKLTVQELKAICEIAEDKGAYVMADEIFRGLELDGSITPSVKELYENGISTGGITKIGLAGLRIGWIIASKEVIEGCKVIRDYTTLSNSPLTEQLAILALRKDNYLEILERGRQIIQRNFKILSSWIEETPSFSWIPPEAGTVSFPRFDLDIDAVTLCSRLLEEEGIMMVPGEAYLIPMHVRMGFGTEEEILKGGLERLSNFIEKKLNK